MNHRVLVCELPPLRKKGSVASRHHRYACDACRRSGPETSPESIVVHGCCSDASDARPRERHIGVLAMHTGAAGTVLVGKDRDDYITQIIQFPLCDAIDVVFNGVYLD